MPTRNCGAYCALVVAVLCLLEVPVVHGDIVASGSVYPSNPSTWEANTTAYVGRYFGGTLSITDGSLVDNGSGYVGEGSGTTGLVTVDGEGSTWNNHERLKVGNSGEGTMNITDGGYVTNGEAVIAYRAGSTGAVTVDGPGSRWESAAYEGFGESLIVGFSGNGTLDITNGGAVSTVDGFIAITAGTRSVVTVSGDGSTWTNQDRLYIAKDGEGTLNVAAGGMVSTTGICYIGKRHDGVGKITVTGPGSIFTSSDDVRVGGFGSGTMEIRAGGSVSNKAGAIGGYSHGAVTVDGEGSTWTNSETVTVTGTLDITGGGDVSAVKGFVGYDKGTTGVAVVDGEGSTWATSRDIHAGVYGNGTLRITNGGRVVSDRHGYVASGYVGTGLAVVDGGGSTWESGYLHVGEYGDGTLNITGGGAVHVMYETYVGGYGVGEVAFDAGVLTTGTLYAEPSTLTGTGTIHTHGMVSDSSLVFDSEDDLTMTLNLAGQPGQDITINLGVNDQANMGAGYVANGSLEIRNGVAVPTRDGYLGYHADSTGVATVEGEGSVWSTSRVTVGKYGNGMLSITDGGAVSTLYNCVIGNMSDSMGTVVVAGEGTTWTNGGDLRVGWEGSGILKILDGAMVSVADTLRIDHNGGDDSFVRMSNGGMLALFGDADDTLDDFLSLVRGTGAIQYWDSQAADWADITGATMGADYLLEYIPNGNLAGYTILTVPEPATLSLLAVGGLALIRRRRQ